MRESGRIEMRRGVNLRMRSGQWCWAHRMKVVAADDPGWRHNLEGMVLVLPAENNLDNQHLQQDI